MKQIAKKNLTTLDKLEIYKNGKINISETSTKYIAKVEFTNEEEDEFYIRIEFNKSYIPSLLPLLNKKSFIPTSEFLDKRIPINLFEKDTFFYEQGKKPRFRKESYVSGYHAEILLTKTTLSLMSYKILQAIKKIYH